jgi:hypothetical protein
MVPDLRGVVEKACLGRIAGSLPDDVFQGRIGKAGAFDEAIRLVHIGLVVLAVMELEGLRAYMGFEGVFPKGKLGKGDCHGVLPPLSGVFSVSKKNYITLSPAFLEGNFAVL